MGIDFVKQIQIIDLFDQGKSINNIASELKISSFSVLKVQKDQKMG